VTDDPGTPPAPKPRRRRTDTDPSFVPPKVATERRRTRRAPVVEPGAGPPTDAGAVPEQAVAHPPDQPTRMFEPLVGATAGVSDPPTWLPDLEDRSPDPAVCPFLRSVAGERLVAPIEAPDAANRCAAFPEAAPQSLRQQELVCLTSGHVNCPRYLRGAATMTAVAPAGVRGRRTLTPAIIASIAILVVAFSASVLFTLTRGEPDPGTAASPSASATDTTAVASPSPAPTVDPSPASTASPAPRPTASPSVAATAAPTDSPPPSVLPSPTSDRYLLLTSCPDGSGCWVYVVRAGDNLFSIANYFGVELSVVYDMNPWLTNQGLRPRQELRLPPPTR
jgi:LysM repeat protein